MTRAVITIADEPKTHPKISFLQGDAITQNYAKLPALYGCGMNLVVCRFSIFSWDAAAATLEYSLMHKESF